MSERGHIIYDTELDKFMVWDADEGTGYSMIAQEYYYTENAYVIYNPELDKYLSIGTSTLVYADDYVYEWSDEIIDDPDSDMQTILLYQDSYLQDFEDITMYMITEYDSMDLSKCMAVRVEVIYDNNVYGGVKRYEPVHTDTGSII